MREKTENTTGRVCVRGSSLQVKRLMKRFVRTAHTARRAPILRIPPDTLRGECRPSDEASSPSCGAEPVLNTRRGALRQSLLLQGVRRRTSQPARASRVTPANRCAENHRESPSAGAGPTVEDVALLQRPSVRDAVADDLVDGRAAGLGEVVVVERRRVAVPRRAGLATASTSRGRYNLDWRRRCLPIFIIIFFNTYVCAFLPDAQRGRFLPW